MRFSLVIVAGMLMLASCAKKESLSTISTDTAVSPESTGNAVNTVASDKELLRQALLLADSKGTLEPALTEAAQDSLIGIKMRTALILGNEAKSRATPPNTSATKPPPHHAGSGTKTSTSSTKTSGDFIDKANGAVSKTNQELNKTGTLIDNSKQAAKKAGDLLNGNH